MSVADYIALPWTVRRSEHDDDGHYIALTVDELPGLVAAGRSEEEAEVAFWDALSAFLRSYLEAGEQPPLPSRPAAYAAQPEMLEMRYVGPDLTVHHPAGDAASTSWLTTKRYVAGLS